jgi:hypothetical protein
MTEYSTAELRFAAGRADVTHRVFRIIIKNREGNMKAKILLATAVVLTFAAPAMADEYYVVRGPDRHCTVTTTRPTEQTTVTQIGPLAFESREKAQDRIKTTKVCSDDTTTGTSVHIDKD